MSFAIALAFAVVAVPVARRVGLATGLVDRPEDPALAIHARPVPLLGGAAVVVAALAGVLVAGDGPSAAVWAVLAGVLAIGLVDDVRPLPPLVRLVLVGAAGAGLVAANVEIAPLGLFAGVATLALMVACVNAANILDGQNGLTGGCAAIAAAALAAAAPAGTPARTAGFALAGALAGFLIWNLPGRVFLGNGGAYAVGAFLAFLAADVSRAEGWRGVMIAVVCLGAFAFEILFTIVRRLASGAAITTGDRMHSYDLVAERSGSRLRSTIAFWALGAAAAAAGLWIDAVPVGAGVAIAAAVALVAAIAGWRLWARRPQPTRT